MATSTERHAGTLSWVADPTLLRCPACHGSLDAGDRGDGLNCAGCQTFYSIRDGVLVVKDEPTADNKIARDFYNSALWPKFRFWEKFFWVCNGGERRSREVILRHLPNTSSLRLLDIAIGDGVYTSWLPPEWSIVGLDVSTAQLVGCQKRNAGRDLRLILGEAETLPFHDHQFDAVLSIGGFNHFNDPEKALREMARVAKPGVPIVVSDEMPDLTDRMLGHKIGLPGIDRWIVSRLMKLGDDFTDLVERHRDIDIAAIGQRVLRDSRFEIIWRGGGYVMVGQAP
jgi:ubiquinone/menaquinone biosynthesis C-methylase UbiE